MNQQYSKCDVPDHPDEYIVGLCLDKACSQKPEYCYLCKTEGEHFNHQNKCYNFFNLREKFSSTYNILLEQRKELLKVLQNTSQLVTNFLNIKYQKYIDDCEVLISITKDENVQQSKNKIDLFQYFLDINYEELRKFILSVEEVCQKFEDEMKKIMVLQKNQISSEIENTVIESQISNQSNHSNQNQNNSIQEQINQDSKQSNSKPNYILSQEQQIQKAEKNNDDDDIFNYQLQQILEYEQSQSFKLSYQASQIVGNSQKALQLLDQAIRLYENNEDALLQKGTILHNQGKYDQTMEILEKLIYQNSHESRVYSIYAACLSQKDKVEEADEFYKKAIQMNPIDSTLYSSRGNFLNSQGNYQEAIVCCDAAIELNQKNAEAYNTKAHSLSKLNKSQQAIDNYELAYQFDPTQATYLANKGTLLLNVNKINEASICLDRIEQLAEKNEIYFQFKSRLLMKQGNLEQALETCNEGLLFFPNSENLQEKKQQIQVDISCANS